VDITVAEEGVSMSEEKHEKYPTERSLSDMEKMNIDPIQ